MQERRKFIVISLELRLSYINPSICICTVECRYNAVQLIKISYTALRWQQQNVNQTSNSQQTWSSLALHWRHNDHGGVSNHQPRGCLLNRLFRHRWKKTSKLRVTGFCAGNSPGPVNSPHKGPVTRKMFPFDDVITARYGVSIMKILKKSDRIITAPGCI